MTMAVLPEALAQIDEYIAALRDFLGRAGAVVDVDEFEECLRTRVADAGASAALRAADEAVVPSLHDFLGPAS
jgi:hypothetical protein